MQEALSELLDRLDLEQIEVNLFRTTSPNEGWQSVFGGQVLAQALVAASGTVDDKGKTAHSLHAYFLRPGDMGLPIVYNVDRIRDGKSFTTRRVVAIQNGRPIFNMAVSFHQAETGLNHQVAIPDVPGPLECLTEAQMREAMMADAPPDFEVESATSRPIEMRYVDPLNEFKPEKMAPVQHVWFRTTEKMPDDIRAHQCVLAYASDMTLLDTSVRPHAISWSDTRLQMASLDHAMWFHRPFKVDSWLLYAQDSPSSSSAKGFNRGSVFTESGELVTSVAQEGLMRLHSSGLP
jgi:acyl-CoA thioesterase-2